MKKSLVALAAMAVVGAASAQVTITGTVSAGYQTSLDGTHGIAVTDNLFTFGDTEDLGGGTKLVMTVGGQFGGTGQTGGGNFGGGDGAIAKLALTGSLGTLSLQQFESDGPFAAIDALSGASLPVGLFDTGAMTGGKRFRNGVIYTTPNISGFTPGISYVTLANTFVSTSALDAKTKVTPFVTFEQGPLKAYLEYSVFNASYNAPANANLDPANQPTAYVTYDFGAAKVGIGYSKPSTSDAFYGLGVSVPVGAVTVGLATFVNNVNGNGNNSNVPNTFGTATFTEASVSYALSKRTSLKASFGAGNDAFVALANQTANANYGTVGTGNANTLGLTQNCESRIALSHSF
jgi:hypothetical protein